MYAQFSTYQFHFSGNISQTSASPPLVEIKDGKSKPFYKIVNMKTNQMTQHFESNCHLSLGKPNMPILSDNATYPLPSTSKKSLEKSSQQKEHNCSMNINAIKYLKNQGSVDRSRNPTRDQEVKLEQDLQSKPSKNDIPTIL